MIGDSLRKHPENVIYNFTQGVAKDKLMNGSYAHIHVYKLLKNASGLSISLIDIQ